MKTTPLFAGKKRRADPEHRLQRAVAQHLVFRAAPGIYWSSIDHASRDKILNAERKKRGVKAGLPDILIIADGAPYGLELKVGKGRQSNEQRATEAEWFRAGGVYAVAHGINQALAILEGWGIIKPDASAAVSPVQARAA